MHVSHQLVSSSGSSYRITGTLFKKNTNQTKLRKTLGKTMETQTQNND